MKKRIRWFSNIVQRENQELINRAKRKLGERGSRERQRVRCNFSKTAKDGSHTR